MGAMTRLASRKSKYARLLTRKISKLNVIRVVIGLFTLAMIIVIALGIIGYLRDTSTSRIQNWTAYENDCHGQVYIAVKPPWLAKYLGYNPLLLEASAFTSPT